MDLHQVHLGFSAILQGLHRLVPIMLFFFYSGALNIVML